MEEPNDVDLILDHCNVASVAGEDGPLAGELQGDLNLVDDAAIAISNGVLVGVGNRNTVLQSYVAGETVDLQGRAVVPGFVDAHTHPIWAGSRAAEFEMRVGGATYLDIMAAGGGIASTVRASREASDEELLSGVLQRLDDMMRHGTTTVEAKTGYGQSTAEELRQLSLLHRADELHPVRIVPTFLGAHAVPDEYRGRIEDYVDLVVDEMLPAVAESNPGVFVDVFCDEGAFNCRQTERILVRAAEFGLRLKVHSDEFANLGCTALAAELGATSADHLGATSREEMEMMAKSGTIAVLLPGTSFGLGHSRYAPARRFVTCGVPVAIGTDLNPGTCPCESMPFMLALATRYLELTPAEALVAATRNAAYASGCGSEAGRLEEGWPADLAVLASTDCRDLAYRFGTNLVAGVMIGGRWTVPLD
jgi:imidazolonepropionase